MTHKKLTIRNALLRGHSRQFAAKILAVLTFIAALLLTACGELEFGVETKVSSGRPDVTVVTTTVAQIPEGMVLVTVTPTAQAIPTDTPTGSPTAVATETPTPTATATQAAAVVATAVQPPPTRQPVWPTATPTPDWAEVVVYPTVSSIIWPGESVTIDYEVHANSAALCLAPPFTQDWTCYSAPTTGPFTLDIPATTKTNLQFELRAFSDYNQTVAAGAVLLYCDKDAWFFSGPPVTCPAGQPVQTAAAYQQFEHGTMFWLDDGQWWDPGSAIYVLYNEQNQVFDPFPEYSLPDADAPTPNTEYEPPEGLYVPESGFGLLWREYSWVRQRLGWALAPEVGYTATIQREFVQDGSNLYLLDADNQLLVLNLFNGTWAERSQP